MTLVDCRYVRDSFCIERGSFVQTMCSGCGFWQDEEGSGGSDGGCGGDGLQNAQSSSVNMIMMITISVKQSISMEYW
jgi:hypothetical protein